MAMPTLSQENEVLFDYSNENWSTTPEYNLLFIRMIERWANDSLAKRGHIFVNELHDRLGIDRTPRGQLHGWFFPNGNCVQIEIESRDDESVMLKFVDDGDIHEQI